MTEITTIEVSNFFMDIFLVVKMNSSARMVRRQTIMDHGYFVKYKMVYNWYTSPNTDHKR